MSVMKNGWSEILLGETLKPADLTPFVTGQAYVLPRAGNFQISWNVDSIIESH